MRNKKGQALVEFIIIVPVIVYFILIIIDLMVIFSDKSNLEGRMDDVVYLYKENRSSEINDYLNKDLKNVTYSVNKDDKYTYIEATMEYKFMTPGLKNIVGNKYSIKCKRVIINGE